MDIAHRLQAFWCEIVGPLLSHIVNIHVLIFDSAQAHSLNEIIGGRFLVGLGIGVNTVLVPIYISEVLVDINFSFGHNHFLVVQLTWSVQSKLYTKSSDVFHNGRAVIQLSLGQLVLKKVVKLLTYSTVYRLSIFFYTAVTYDSCTEPISIIQLVTYCDIHVNFDLIVKK